MKELEFRLVSELMKNSRRSDRQLARKLGTSQPTVSRLVRKLEREGVLREYTVIADYQKLGFQIAAFTFVRIKSDLSQRELAEARKTSLHDMREAPAEIVLFERGMGSGFNGLIVSFHDSYASYRELRERTKLYPFVDSSATESFLVDLNDNVHYRYLTFSTLANHLLKRITKEEE